MQNTKEKYTRYVISFIFIFLGFIGMSVYPTSHSKFIDANDNALIYETKLHKLYKGSLDTVHFGANSTYKTLLFDFDLPRNNVALSNEVDNYIIDIPKSCRVVTSGLTILNSTDTSNRYQTSFNGSTQVKNIQVSCNVPVDPSGVKHIQIPIEIYEKVASEQVFLYKDYNYEIVNYYSIKPLPSIISTTDKFEMPKDAIQKYTSFVEWIREYMNTNYAGDDVLSTTVLNYVQTVYKNDQDLLNRDKVLQGIKMTYDSTKDVYTYQIESNLVGYAKTYYATNPRFMYFSSKDPQELEEAFEYYLTKWYSLESDRKLILDYIRSFTSDGISYLILPNEDGSYNNIKGIDYFYTDNNQLVLDALLLDYAYSFVHNLVRISYNDVSMNMANSYAENLKIVFGDAISEVGYNAILRTSALFQSVIRTSVDVFHDYFMVYDEGLQKNVMIEVYSLAGEDYNYIDLHVLDLPSDITLSLISVDGEVKILVNNITVADLNSFVEQLVLNESIIITGPEDGETSLLIKGATAEEIIDIIAQLNAYLETLKTNNAIISKDEDEEPVLDSTEEIGVKE